MLNNPQFGRPYQNLVVSTNLTRNDILQPSFYVYVTDQKRNTVQSDHMNDSDLDFLISSHTGEIYSATAGINTV